MANQEKMSWEEAVVWLRDQADAAETVKHCYYDDPVSAAAKRYHASAEWLSARKHLPKGPGSALDIGAGRGISSFALARDGWKVTALEPDRSDIVGSGAICRLIEETGVHLEVVHEWGESLPFQEGRFDLVYCRAVLHHARDLRQLCREIARVLRPGGRLVATREHVVSKIADRQAFFETHPLHSLYGGENAYLLAEYKQAIESAGLRLQSVINPFQSDINIFPETRACVKSRLSRRLKVVPQWLIPDFALALYGRINRTPGRLYSFVASKPS